MPKVNTPMAPIYAINKPFYDVADYGNLPSTGIPNGVASNSAMIIAAANAANLSGGGVVFFGEGTWRGQGLPLYPNVYYVGAGQGTTTIKLEDGANTDLFSAQTSLINLSAASGSGSNGTLFNFGFRDLTLDGNKAKQTSGTSYPLRCYGYRGRFENVIFTNGFTGGMLMDWNGTQPPAPYPDAKSVFSNCDWHDNNGIGCQMGGPHDPLLINCNSYLNGTHGFHFAPNCSAPKVMNCHSWGTVTPASSVAWLLECEAGMFTNCSAEGSTILQVLMLGADTTWLGCHVFSTTPPNSVVGIQLGQSAGQTPFSGQIYQSAGVTTAKAVQNVVIEGPFIEMQGGALNFVNESRGMYFVRARQTAGVYVVGTPNNTDQFWIAGNGLTADGTLAKSGGIQMANGGFSGLLFYDANGNQYFNMNPNSKKFALGGGGQFEFYSDNFFSTLQASINTVHGDFVTNGNISVGMSATDVVLASSGTIATADIGLSRVAPTGAVTGVILQAGTVNGQQVTVRNNSAFTITFAIAGTSHVADGTSDVIAANNARDFRWDGALWYPVK